MFIGMFLNQFVRQDGCVRHRAEVHLQEDIEIRHYPAGAVAEHHHHLARRPDVPDSNGLHLADLLWRRLLHRQGAGTELEAVQFDFRWYRHLRWLCHCRYRPTIDADDNDVAYAMSATFLFDMAMIVLFPIMGRALGMTDQAFGIWAGTAVSGTKTASKFLMVCALAAIGLNTSFAA